MCVVGQRVVVLVESYFIRSIEYTHKEDSFRSIGDRCFCSIRLSQRFTSEVNSQSSHSKLGFLVIKRMQNIPIIVINNIETKKHLYMH